MEHNMALIKYSKRVICVLIKTNTSLVNGKRIILYSQLSNAFPTALFLFLNRNPVLINSY